MGDIDFDGAVKKFNKQQVYSWRLAPSEFAAGAAPTRDERRKRAYVRMPVAAHPKNSLFMDYSKMHRSESFCNLRYLWWETVTRKELDVVQS